MSRPIPGRRDKALQAELGAMAAITDALEPLSPAARERVLRAAAELIDVWQPLPKPSFPPPRRPAR